MSVLVARNDPLDQYLMRHPDFFFGRSHEHALIAPDNPRILDQHLLCAAYERPLGKRDERFYRPGPAEPPGPRYRWKACCTGRANGGSPSAGVAYPAEEVNIRSSSHGSYAVVSSESGALLEMVDEGSAFSQLHTGAVYLHYGDQYLVERLDLDSKTAYVSPREVQYYTRTHSLTDIRVRHVMEQRSVGGIDVYLGEVEVSNQVVSYQRRAFNDEPIADEMLDLPPQQFSTVALWFNPREDDLARIKSERLDLSGGLHAAEHAAIGVLPLFALCDRNDIGGVSTPFHPDTRRPQIFIYDGHEGGVGIAEKGYRIIEELWRATLQVLQECPCEDGCPACIQSPKCGNNNHPLDKGVAAMLLRGALGL